jgi:hypothetical protein
VSRPYVARQLSAKLSRLPAFLRRQDGALAELPGGNLGKGRFGAQIGSRICARAIALEVVCHRAAVAMSAAQHAERLIHESVRESRTVNDKGVHQTFIPAAASR